MEYYQELREFQNSLKNLSDTITAARVLWNDENYAQLSQSVIEVANMSRAVSADAVKKGLVSLNYDTNCQVSASVSDGDVISVRGYGKFIIRTDGTLTKKGRYHIQILQYI